MKIKSLFLIVLFLLGKIGYSQKTEANQEFSFLFYNTENFFDSENDTTKNDEEYLANALKNWTRQRFRLKAERIAKVIVAAGRWNSPLLVGLCEIENRDVLELLVKTEPLAGFHYKIVQKDSPDPRGIDVAMLYRPDFFRPVDYDAIRVADPENPNFRTRDILKVTGVIAKTDTLIVYINHWPSRYGGIMETKKYRAIAAQILRNSIDKELKIKPDAKIVCMGDFNDTPTDESMSSLLAAKPAQIARNQDLINLSSEWLRDDIQTIKSRYRWETFDQFIVSPGFLHSGKTVSYKNAEIYKGNFLLEKDSNYGGLKPKRTYQGLRYHDGFSDHLPIVLRMQVVSH